MTGNNNIKFVINNNQFKPEPYIPKTYEVAYLDNLYPELSYQDVSNQKGYGPCSYSNKDCTCYVSSGYVPLYMSCPSCSNKSLSVWTHSGGGCYGPMYISESLYLECKRCYTSDGWRNWQFSCSEHQGYEYPTSVASFNESLRLGLAIQYSNSSQRPLVKRISIKLIEQS